VTMKENSKLKKQLVELEAHKLGKGRLGSSNYGGSGYGGSSGTCTDQEVELFDGQTCKIVEVSGANFQTKECSFPQAEALSITSDCGNKASDGVTKECKTSGSSYCTACKEQCGHIMIKKTLDNQGTCHEWDDFTADDTNGASFPTGGAGRLDDCEETCWNLKYNTGSSSWPESVPRARLNSTVLNTFKNAASGSPEKEEGVHFNCVTMCTKKIPILTDEYENGDVLCDVFKASAVTLTPPPPPGSAKEEVEFSHLGQSDEKDNNMDNKLYDLGAAMSHEASMLRDIDSDLGDATSGRQAAMAHEDSMVMDSDSVCHTDASVGKECKTSGSSLCTACKEDCGHIMIQKLDNNGTMEGTCHEWDDFTAGATPTPTQEPAFMYTRAESLQAQCNTVCKPHTIYNSKDNVGSNCKPEACDDKLCMDALAPPPPPPSGGGERHGI